MNIEALINQYYSSLNENDLHIANYMMQHKESIKKITIAELAKETLTSKSSILRLTKKLGFSGFSEFKYALRGTSQDQIPSNLSFLGMQEEDLRGTAKLFAQQQTRPIIEHFHKARMVYCYGTGWGQRDVLKNFNRSLTNSKKFPVILESLNEFRMVVNRTVQPEDLVIIVSLSGDISQAEEVTRLLSAKKIPLLSITNLSNNTLASMATYNLYFQSTPIHFMGDDEYSLLPIFQLTDSLRREYLDYLIELNDSN
ncbi:MurR/RpiR family transcriptional regulator [Marinilactibacillus kalidii]|uniref:MurR/RpiR family transcriptional regulator n=1 Tax=Marinilactibacillus kalidii TaxID=2820274 RepID=UPI001ABEE400|nr:MurR/RpiR family transcriptional regulator [Marinilactibacillus kalidii]